MKVSIVMGSISDKNIGEKVVKTLKEFGVDYEVKVISAHRSLDLALDYCRDIDKNNIEVLIAIAGKAAHLAGVLAGIVTIPVIGIPVKASALEGLDALKHVEVVRFRIIRSW